MGDLVTQEHDDLIKELAYEVAKNVIDHHKNVYAPIFCKAPSTFATSIRNGIYNQICSVIKCRDDNEIRAWLKRSKEHRKEMQRIKRGRTP